MSERQAAKIFLKFLLTQLQEDRKQKFENIDDVVEQMHDDHQFMQDLLTFLDDHLDDFGENYGL